MTLFFALLLGADVALAGEEYVRGLRLLEEKKYDEAVTAFEAAIRNQSAETPYLKYRNAEGRHRHAYFPYYESARARLAQVADAPSLYVKRDRLEAAVRYLRQTSHPEGAAKLAEASAQLEEVRNAIDEAEANAPPPELVALRTKVEKLSNEENFEGALAEIAAGSALFAPKHERIRTNLISDVKTRQTSALGRYDTYLRSRLESISRGDPTLEAETILPALKPARVPPEVSKDPEARFKWLIEFYDLYEKELDRIKACATLPPAELLPAAARFEEAARKALEIDLVPGFRAARNMGHCMRLARLKELAYAEDPNAPGAADYRPTAQALADAGDDFLKKAEAEVQGKAALAEGAAAAALKKYVETELPYQRRQVDGLRKRVEEAVLAYDRRVAAEKLVKTSEEGLFHPALMGDPEEYRKVGRALSGLESQAYFETLPPVLRARVLFTRAITEAMVVFLEAESSARAAERCRGDIAKAFALDPQVDLSWRDQGKLSPKILAVFDQVKKR